MLTEGANHARGTSGRRAIFVAVVLIAFAWLGRETGRADDVPASQPATRADVNGPGATRPAEPPRTGEYDITFDHRSPMSQPWDLARRFTDLKRADKTDYNLADFPFLVDVPESYDGRSPYGLVVFFNYEEVRSGPLSLRRYLERSRLIFVAPRRVDVPDWQKAALAMDAAWNMARRFNIDPRRVYLVGFNHFNQIALATSDVFSGNMTIWGTFYCRTFNTFGPDGKASWRFVSRDSRPPNELFRRATGRGQVRTISPEDGPDDFRARLPAAMKRDGFEHVLLLSVSPEDAHYPEFNAELFAKALDFLDSVSQDQSTSTAAIPPPDSGQEENAAGESPAAQSPAGIDEAQNLLNLAHSYIDADRSDLAVQKLQELLKQYPDSPQAEMARKLLKQLGSKG